MGTVVRKRQTEGLGLIPSGRHGPLAPLRFMQYYCGQVALVLKAGQRWTVMMGAVEVAPCSSGHLG